MLHHHEKVVQKKKRRKRSRAGEKRREGKGRWNMPATTPSKLFQAGVVFSPTSHPSIHPSIHARHLSIYPSFPLPTPPLLSFSPTNSFISSPKRNQHLRLLDKPTILPHQLRESPPRIIPDDLAAEVREQFTHFDSAGGDMCADVLCCWEGWRV